MKTFFVFLLLSMNLLANTNFDRNLLSKRKDLLNEISRENLLWHNGNERPLLAQTAIELNKDPKAVIKSYNDLVRKNYRLVGPRQVSLISKAMLLNGHNFEQINKIYKENASKLRSSSPYALSLLTTLHFESGMKTEKIREIFNKVIKTSNLNISVDAKAELTRAIVNNRNDIENTIALFRDIRKKSSYSLNDLNSANLTTKAIKKNVNAEKIYEMYRELDKTLAPIEKIRGDASYIL